MSLFNSKNFSFACNYNFACEHYFSSQMIGGYAEIHLHASTIQPPPHTEDKVQYSVLDMALLSATSTTSPPPVFTGERSQQTLEKEELINKADVHPLGKLYSVSSRTKHSFKHSYHNKYLITLGYPHNIIYIMQTLIIF